MHRQISQLHSFIEPGKSSLKNFNPKHYESLAKIGIGMDERTVRRMIHAMDAIQPTVTAGSIGTPIQFLQNWLPGFVNVITAARKIDDLIGLATIGSWEDSEIVQGIMELVGTSQPYGDTTNIPKSSWNTNFVNRNVVRFEEGMSVGALEAAQAARMRVDSGSQKRQSSALALEIVRNMVGFYGYNNGANLTYGFLNDPGLPSYVTVPVGVSGFTTWAKKTYLEIVADILTSITQLRNQSLDQIDPEKTDLTLALPTAVVDRLSTSTDFGYSVRKWLTETYPRVRVVSAPELNLANGGANVFYLFADKVDDMSTDDGRTFLQVVPSKFQVLGVQQLAKAYEEDYINATAGTMCKRPYAVVRYSGI
jgi:hypothetical protein